MPDAELTLKLIITIKLTVKIFSKDFQNLCFKFFFF